MSESTQRLEAALAAAFGPTPCRRLISPRVAARAPPPGGTSRADPFAGPHLVGSGAPVRPRGGALGPLVTPFHSVPFPKGDDHGNDEPDFCLDE